MTRGRALLLMLLATACGKPPLAEMKSHQGDVKRDTMATKEHWESASDGAKFAMGDALRTGAKADAVVRLGSGGTIAVASDTTIRFVVDKKGSKSRVAVETGEASIDAEDQAVIVETSVGVAQIEPRGKLHVTADGRVEVMVGAARLETEDGGVSLTPGHPFDVSLGGAVLETADAAAPADAAPPPTTSGIAIDVHGAGARIQAKGETAFKPLAEGASVITPGDTLDLPASASVDLRRGPRHAKLVGTGRFVVADGEGDPLVTASGGRVELEATTQDVSVQVPGGTIVAKADGKTHLVTDVSAATTKVSVQRGQGELHGKSATETARAGEMGTITAKGVVTTSNRAPERPDFTVHAGESVVLRDPRPPTALGIDFSSACPGAAVLSRSDGTVTSRGEHKAALGFPAGVYTYEVRCIGTDGVDEKPAATGTVTVVTDSARAELPRLAPSTVVDADGRRYTVLYQNLLPAVVARWPSAPAANAYVLTVGKERTRSTTPKVSLKPGSIAEGTHTLVFETEDGSKKSSETTLVIKFDNAAPAASVHDPVDGSFQSGDTVKVSGVVVEGWTVSINGTTVPLDEQRRFSTTATVPLGETSLALKLSHPKRGTVYYVRHARP